MPRSANLEKGYLQKVSEGHLLPVVLPIFYPFGVIGEHWNSENGPPNRKVSENLAFQLPYIIFAQQRAKPEKIWNRTRP